ncbi:MAG: EAL domain-containing protein [Euzebyales bacterium]|nr:EAL domain-containing protein [Euzebyales bacterium]
MADGNHHHDDGLRLALAVADLSLWTWDVEGEQVTWLGQRDDEPGLVRQHRDADVDELLHAVHPDDRAALGVALRAALAGAARDLEFRVLGPSGEVRWMRGIAHVDHRAGGRPKRMVAAVRDVGDRRAAEAPPPERESHYRRLFEAGPRPAWVYDRETLAFLDVNAAAVATYGYTRQAFLSMTIADIRPAEDVPAMRTAVSGLEKGGFTPGPWRHRYADGSTHDVEVTSTDLPFAGRPGRLVVVEDVTERRRFESQLARRALHDTLTDLPNRALLLDRLGHALAAGARRDGVVAVLFVDLDHFKQVNDTVGHEGGDQLLVAVAARLRETMRPGDTVARLSGDEFIVVCEDVDTPEAARTLADRITEKLSLPFTVEGTAVYVGASVGVAVAAGPPTTPEKLLHDADLAMYRAKQLGRGRSEMFDKRLRDRSRQRSQTETALRQALGNRELRLAFQTQIDLRSGRPVGVEALLRWEHPQRGLLEPGAFLSVAEDTGLILPIGEWVLKASCRQAVRWRSELRSTVRMAVNVSHRQLSHPSFAGFVERVLGDTDLVPDDLVLEITENAVLDDEARTLEALRELRDLGVRLVVDDFGTGYSSMRHLREMPFLDGVKIDRSFVAGLGRNAVDSAIVVATIALGQSLGLTVTAEGVETVAQADRLIDLGCDEAQGFHYGRAQPAAAVASLLAAG